MNNLSIKGHVLICLGLLGENIPEFTTMNGILTHCFGLTEGMVGA